MKNINRNVVKKVLLAALALLIIMQVFSIDKSTQPIDPKLDFYAEYDMPKDVKNILQASCNDCHSEDRAYPWYTNIEPVSWWIKGHIKGGMQNLNFSIWNSYEDNKKKHKIEEIIEVLEQKRMPLKSYTWIHKGTNIDDAKRAKLIAFFKSISN